MSKSENVNMTAADQEVQKDYASSYSPKVHVIGRTTMAIALVLSYLPVAYLYFVKGYQLPFTTYIAVAGAIAAMYVGMWIAEPFTWFPVLGAAPLYMSYFAGNCKNVRVPIASTLQKNYDVAVETPRGQVVTTIGVAISVYVNLIILFVVVMVGNWFIPLLTTVILKAFDYVIPALIGALLSFRVSKYGIKKSVMWMIPGLVMLLLIKTGITPFLKRYGTSSAVGVTVLIAYVVYVLEGKKAEKADQ